MNENQIKCPRCEGAGNAIGLALSKGKVIEMTCPWCEGTGSVERRVITWIERGVVLKQSRLDRHTTLREESKRRGIDAATLSRAERGIIDPDTIKTESTP